MSSLRSVDDGNEYQSVYDWYAHVETHMDAVIPEVFGIRTDGQPDGQPGLKARVERLEQVMVVQTGVIAGLLLVAVVLIYLVSR